LSQPVSDLSHYLVSGQAFLPAPHQGHDAVRAKVTASILDLDEGTGAEAIIEVAGRIGWNVSGITQATGLLQQSQQIWFCLVAQDKVNPLNLRQLVVSSFRVATGSHYQGVGISAVRLSQSVTGFAVGNMGNRAGIQYIDISLISWGYQPITCLSKLSG